jgi:putative transposase
VSMYRLIDEESPHRAVSRWCRTLGVSRSGFSEWKRSPVSDRTLADAALLAVIDQIYAESRQTYGSPGCTPSFGWAMTSALAASASSG